MSDIHITSDSHLNISTDSKDNAEHDRSLGFDQEDNNDQYWAESTEDFNLESDDHSDLESEGNIEHNTDETGSRGSDKINPENETKD